MNYSCQIRKFAAYIREIPQDIDVYEKKEFTDSNQLGYLTDEELATLETQIHKDEFGNISYTYTVFKKKDVLTLEDFSNSSYALQIKLTIILLF